MLHAVTCVHPRGLPRAVDWSSYLEINCGGLPSASISGMHMAGKGNLSHAHRRDPRPTDALLYYEITVYISWESLCSSILKIKRRPQRAD
jgi:hypothetical protein